MNTAAALSMTNLQYPLFLTRSSIKTLKKEVSPPLYRSLEGIWEIMKSDVLNTLALAKNSSDFEQRVEKVLPNFSFLRIALLFLLYNYYKEDFDRLEDEIMQALSLFDKNIDKRGKNYLNEVEQLTLKSVLHTTREVTRRVIQLSITINQGLLKGKQKEIKWTAEMNSLLQSAIYLELCLTFIFSVFEKQVKPINNNLIRICLAMANEYSSKYYYYAKRVGILSPFRKIRVSFPKKLSKEALREDKELTEASMRNLSKSLKRDENS